MADGELMAWTAHGMLSGMTAGGGLMRADRRASDDELKMNDRSTSGMNDADDADWKIDD